MANKINNEKEIKIRKVQATKKLTKLIASGAIFTILGVGAIAKSKPVEKTYNNPLIGLNITSRQENIDWDIVRQRFQYVLLDASEALNYIDDYNECNFNQAIDHDLEVGLIYPYGTFEIKEGEYINDISTTEEKLKSHKEIEIMNFCSSLDDFEYCGVTWPIYLDLTNVDIDKIENKDYLKGTLEGFNDVVKGLRFKSGIYSTRDQLDKLKEIMPDITNDFETLVINDNKEEYENNNAYIALKNKVDLLNQNDITMVEAYKYVKNTGAKDTMEFAPVLYSNKDYYVKQVNYPLYLLVGYSAVKVYEHLYRKKEEAKIKKLKKLPPSSK